LAGLAVALALHSPAAVFPAAGVVENLWRNLITLERPRDNTALDVYEAFLKRRTILAQAGGGHCIPSTTEVHTQTGSSNPADTLSGLIQLWNLKILEATTVDGAVASCPDEESRWREVI
jgi:hypothetical protein